MYNNPPPPTLGTEVMVCAFHISRKKGYYLKLSSGKPIPRNAKKGATFKVCYREIKNKKNKNGTILSCQQIKITYLKKSNYTYI